MPEARLGLPLILCLIISGFVYADTTSPPCSFRAYSHNNDYFFVMLAPKEKKNVACGGQTRARKKEAREIERDFASSGMYSKLDRSPLWTVDWYSDEVYISDDGKYVVRIGPWINTLDSEAFSIISEKGTVKEYKIHDFFKSSDSLPRSASHIKWNKSFWIDDKRGLLIATTFDDQEIQLSLQEGNIVAPPSGSPSAAEAKPATKVCPGVVLMISILCSYVMATRSGSDL